VLLGHRHTPSARISEPGGAPVSGVLVGGIGVLVGARVGVGVGIAVGSSVLVGCGVFEVAVLVGVVVRVGTLAGVTASVLRGVDVELNGGAFVSKGISVGTVAGLDVLAT